MSLTSRRTRHRLGKRRFLGTYEIKNVTENDLVFTIELNSGLVVEQSLEARKTAKGVNGHAKILLQKWIDSGELRCLKEYEWVEPKPEPKPNWKEEGF